MEVPNKLNLFFESTSGRSTITAHDISLFASIYSVYQANFYSTEFHTSRRSLMLKRKIRSKATYHKCLKDLIESGYIIYKPSYHPIDGSIMTII